MVDYGDETPWKYGAESSFSVTIPGFAEAEKRRPCKDLPGCDLLWRKFSQKFPKLIE
jgi:hypothetical protein